LLLNYLTVLFWRLDAEASVFDMSAWLVYWWWMMSEQFSVVMKPHPFSSLNHLTVLFWWSDAEASILI
jgi:hypothetical protein